MSAILIIFVFLIVVASIAILRTKRTQPSNHVEYLPRGSHPPSLFGDGRESDEEEEKKAAGEFQKNLLSRAAQRDFEALKDAHAGGDAMLYQLVLGSLIERCDMSEGCIRGLADFITQNEELRANAALAGRLLEDCEQNPSLASVMRLLRISALSDDAAAFERAVSYVMRARSDERFDNLSAEELRSLFEGEYWLLSSEAKRSGAGFLLKQRLSHARRELSAERLRDNPPTAGGANAKVSAQKERQ